MPVDAVKTVSEHNRSRISKMLIMLFKHWNLSTKDQLGLLGISKNNRSLLQRYRRGDPLTNDRDKLDRVAILLSIHKSLRLLFPHNRNLAYSWMTTPNRAFNEGTPTKLIDEQGMMGLYIVQNYLNRQIGR
jgi:uncharacterized protein (DUF2384 family)